jgi:hypothetical protein
MAASLLNFLLLHRIFRRSEVAALADSPLCAIKAVSESEEGLADACAGKCFNGFDFSVGTRFRQRDAGGSEGQADLQGHRGGADRNAPRGTVEGLQKGL